MGLPQQFLGSAADADGNKLYRVRVASLDGGPVRTSAGYSLVPEHDASSLGTAQTVVLPGVSGTFVLAAAGLLDGRPATTHWVHAPAFAGRFPRVRLDPDVLFVDDGDVLTRPATLRASTSSYMSSA